MNFGMGISINESPYLFIMSFLKTLFWESAIVSILQIISKLVKRL